MKKYIITALILFLTACSSKPEVTYPYYAPYTRFTMLDGKYISSHSFKNDTLVLVFWASWCAKSRRVISEINEYAKNNSNYSYLAVGLDKNEDFEKYSDFIKYQNINSFKHAFSGNAAGDEAFIAYQGREVPLVYIVKNNQVIAAGDDVEVLTETLN